MGELFSEVVREPVAIWTAQGWVCPATYTAETDAHYFEDLKRSHECIKCEARLGVQNPGDTCYTCKLSK